MDNRREELEKAKVKIQEAARQGAEQAGQFAETKKKEWNGLEQSKKKQIIKRAVMIGILCFLIFTIGLKGIASIASVCSGVWFIYCVIKKKSKKIPAILTAVLLVACAILPESSHAPSAVTEEYAVSYLTKKLDQMGWTMSGHDDHIYMLHDKTSGLPVVDAVYRFEVGVNGQVTGVGVLMIGNLETVIKKGNGLALVFAAMQMYDSSISEEKGVEIIAETLSNGEYKYKGITYYYLPSSLQESMFLIKP